eukprot:TRINITY_DN4169_c0_g3_i3.p1 TRINITY_DN4169_c0_g3~~TRINITY_DN4169_c0_g3_i3.p1  ORF type:complete len:1577 (+),score=290.08 TRINITY_DN4169_c0_g3_i3:487-5217(+)
MACDQKGTKMIPIAVSTIHKLIVHNAVDPISVEKITNKLGILVESSDETTQLKILQALLALVTTIKMHGDELRNILRICFQLHNHKQASVHNTAAAALRQLVTMLFDRALAELTPAHSPSFALRGSKSSPANPYSSHHDSLHSHDQSDPSHSPNNSDVGVEKIRAKNPIETTGNFPPSILDAYMLIQDIYNLTEGDPSVWLELDRISKSFGLELIESLFNSHSALFLRIPEFSSLVRERLCPLVIKLFKIHSDFPTVIRILRIMTVFIRYFHQKMMTECEVFLTRIIKMLDGHSLHTSLLSSGGIPSSSGITGLGLSNTSAQNSGGMGGYMDIILSLECLRIIFDNSTILRSLFINIFNVQKNSNSTDTNLHHNIYHSLINSIGQYIKTMFTWDAVHFSKYSLLKFRCLDLLSASEAPTIHEPYVISLSLECLCGLVYGMDQWVENEGMSQEEIKIYPETVDLVESERNRTICTQMASQAWPTLLASFSLLLEKSNDETLTQDILKAYQSFTHVCGALGLHTPRDAFLTSLCKTTLPKKALNTSTTSLEAIDTDLPTYLTPKNVQSMKALFNIAHCMGGVLLDGWGLVLDTFQQLDRILHSSKTILLTSSTLNAPNLQLSPDAVQGQNNELSILAASLDLLFRNTDVIDDQGLLQVLNTLQGISNNAIQQLKPRFLFAATKMAEVASFNTHRIQLFWDTVSHHFIELVNHKDSSIRSFAVDALTNIIQTAFLQKKNESSELIESNSNASGSSEQSDGTNNNIEGISRRSTSSDVKRTLDVNLKRSMVIKQPNRGLEMQLEFMQTLELLSRSNYIECREKALQSLYHILQATGQNLTTCWKIILNILNFTASNASSENAIAKDDKPIIGYAFKSVQIISTDFLSCLSEELLELYITMLSSFGSQLVDLNIALTAINSFWNLSDYIAKIYSSKLNEIVSHESSIDAENLKNINIDKKKDEKGNLWIKIFEEMQTLSTDKRTEIRNCAAQTLFKTAGNHGSELDQSTWETLLWRIVFPLLVSVRSYTVAAADVGSSHLSQEESSSNFKLMLHHSRNTASKQWNETLAITLSGTVRIIKTFFPSLILLPNFSDAWVQLMEEMMQLILFNSTEVSTTAIQSFQDLLLTLSSNNNFKDQLWEMTWSSLDSMGDAIIQKWDIISGQTILNLSKSYLIINQRLQSNFSFDDQKIFIRILRPLSLFLAKNGGENLATDTQENILSILESIQPTDPIFLFVILELNGYLSYAIGFPYENTIDPQIKTLQPKQFQVVEKSYFPFMDRLIQVLCKGFQNTTKDIRNKSFHDVVKTIGSVSMTKYSAYESPLWRSAVNALNLVVKTGLEDISNSQEIDEIHRNIIWTELIDSVQFFLVHDDRSGIPHIGPDLVKRDEDIDIGLVDLLAVHMLSYSSVVPLAQERMIDVLIEGAQTGATRESFTEACYKNLFYLCSIPSSNQDENGQPKRTKETAKMVFPRLMARCKEVLHRVILEDKKSGALPIARSRLVEVNIIMKHLLELEVDAQVSVGEEDESTEEKNPHIALKGRKRHLLLLFPLLCDCITIRETEMKESLKKIFHAAAKELGLE